MHSSRLPMEFGALAKIKQHGSKEGTWFAASAAFPSSCPWASIARPPSCPPSALLLSNLLVWLCFISTRAICLNLTPCLFLALPVPLPSSPSLALCPCLAFIPNQYGAYLQQPLSFQSPTSQQPCFFFSTLLLLSCWIQGRDC